MRRFAVSVVLFCLAACADRDVADVTLAQLVDQQEHYTGRRVVVSGTLRSHPDPLHYWIEDDSYHRVELDHAGNLTGREGERLSVRGIFRYEKDTGRSIEVTSLD